MTDKFVATWAAGMNRRPAPNTSNVAVPPPIANGQEFTVSDYFVPPGKTEQEERWGKLVDSGLWVALVYNSQSRARLVSQEPPPDPDPTVKPLTITIEGELYQTVTVTVLPK